MGAIPTIRQDKSMEMFSGRNIVPWHKGGQVVKGLLTSAEAIKAAKMDWQVESCPVFVKGRELSGYQAIVRADNDETLSIMKERYHIIQNSDAFEFFDEVVGAKAAYYETAGTLHGGRRIWIQASIPGHLFVRGNDKIEKNVLLVSSHDGTYSLMIQFVVNRVVCQNTLSAALNKATNRICLKHYPNYQEKKQLVQKTLEMSAAYFDNLQGVLDILAEQKMDRKAMEKFTEILVPVKDDAKFTTRAEKIRSNLVQLFSEGSGNRGESRWDALNAVTEYVDHHRGTRGDESNRLESALLTSGAAMKQRAFELLTANNN